MSIQLEELGRGHNSHPALVTTMISKVGLLLLGLGLAACGSDTSPNDGGQPDGGSHDTGMNDHTVPDATPDVTPGVDSGDGGGGTGCFKVTGSGAKQTCQYFSSSGLPMDAGSEAGSEDAGDAGTGEGSATEGGNGDAGTGDGSIAEGGTTDSSVDDAGACPATYSLGSCPSNGLFGCCITTDAEGGLIESAVCYYSVSSGKKAEDNCLGEMYDNIPVEWDTKAP
jgi:hypothetical protein